MIEYRPATRVDIDFFYPELKHSFRALVAEDGAKRLGIGGVYYDGEWAVAFSRFDPDIRKYPLALARSAKKVVEFIGDTPCIAIADENMPQAPALLERLGFIHVHGRVYKWTR